MPHLQINIEMDSAAFDWDHGPQAEAARILRELADRAEANGFDEATWISFDFNGNRVCTLHMSEDGHHPANTLDELSGFAESRGDQWNAAAKWQAANDMEIDLTDLTIPELFEADEAECREMAKLVTVACINGRALAIKMRASEVRSRG